MMGIMMNDDNDNDDVVSSACDFRFASWCTWISRIFTACRSNTSQIVRRHNLNGFVVL
jgi:hypothetical protein